MLAVAGPLLAGCSSSMPSMSSVSSLFGSSGSNANASAAASTTGVAATLPADFDCPQVQVRQGASTLTSSANPADPTAMNLRYQVSVGTTARECKMLPGNVISVKVGMQGRVVLGPEGEPGNIDVPIRFAVVAETIDSKVISTKLDRISVSVPPGETNVLFSHVAEGLEFPMPKPGVIDTYVVYIGFDASGLREPEKKRPAPKAKPKPVRTSQAPG